MKNVSDNRTTYKDIALRLSLTHKSKNINELDIAMWCAECEIDLIGDYESFVPYEEVELTVDTTNHRAPLPCNVYRILDVYDSSDTYVKYTWSGIYLNLPSDYTDTVIYINYIGIAVDPETGFPYIKKGHEQACQAYCVNRLYYEDFLTGRIPAYVWQEITDRLDNELAAAKSNFRHIDNEQLRRLRVVMYNMIPRIGNETISHKRFNN